MARDNSGETPLIVSLPHDVLSPYEFPIGTTRIIYTAKDRRCNSQSCVFTVTITGLRMSRIRICAFFFLHARQNLLGLEL